MADRVLVPLPDGRWLALAPEVFREALTEGERMSAVPASPHVVADGPMLVDAAELARLTSTATSWWEAAARDSDCPSVFVGKVRRFKVADCLDWLNRVQERDGNGRSRRCAAAPRATR